MNRWKLVILGITICASSDLWAPDILVSDQYGNIVSMKEQDIQKYSEEYKEFLELNEKGVLNAVVDMLGGALSVAEDVAYTLLSPVQELLKQNRAVIYNNPYRNLTAYVRLGDPICEPELLFRDRRLMYVKQGQERMLKMKLEPEDVLEIGFSCSGGGWRAMCCSLGSCVGAKKIGLLDSVMSISSLSGSTWFLNPWMYSGMDIYEYRRRLIEVASKGIEPSDLQEVPHLLDNVWVKFAFNQPLNVIDLYGALLANSLFRDIAKDPHAVYMSEQRKPIERGELPLPIYTATLGEREKDEFWFEFTPYEVGSRWLGAYVPTWSFGRHFKKGKSRDYAPEQSSGFLMGIFGSAFAADFEDVYEIMLEKIQFPSFLQNVPFAETIFNIIKQAFSKLAYTDLGDIRIAWARVPNFVYKMRGVPHSQYKDIKLVDAGLDFNNPVFALYRKPPYGDAPDIIFVFDSGGDVEFKQLESIAEYADYHGLKFPKITQYDVKKEIMAVFKDDNDPEVPVIVYMPRINGVNLIQKNGSKAWHDYYVGLLEGFDIEKATSSGFAHTFNFDYSKKQTEMLMAMTEYNVLAATERIKEIMKERIELKRRVRNRKK